MNLYHDMLRTEVQKFMIILEHKALSTRWVRHGIESWSWRTNNGNESRIRFTYQNQEVNKTRVTEV